MGTRIELLDLHDGIEIDHELLVERLSYSREWLQHGAHSFVVKLTGKVPTTIGKSKQLKLKPWSLPDKPWLTHATGRSDEPVKIIDESKDEPVIIRPAEGMQDILEFDFRIALRTQKG